jgi:ribonuclease Z
MKKEQLETFLVNRMMNKRWQAGAKAAETLLRGDAVTAVLVGTGGPFPSGRAQSCTALFVNGQFLLFDAGDGAARRMEALNLPVAQLSAVFVTHYHADHYADLGEVIDRSWIMGRRQTLPVYGPPGIGQIVDGFHQTYALEYGYRTAHHGAERMPPQWAKAQAMEFQADESSLPAVVYEQDGVRVTAFVAQHPPIRPNVGYRVEYAGKTVVLSGDTLTTDTLLEQSRGADLLISDVMAMDVIRQMQSASETLGNEFAAHIMHDIRDYHIGTEELGTLAQKAQVKRLALTHLSPPLEQRALVHSFFKRPIAARYTGKIIVGRDGTRIVIPLVE